MASIILYFFFYLFIIWAPMSSFGNVEQATEIQKRMYAPGKEKRTHADYEIEDVNS